MERLVKFDWSFFTLKLPIKSILRGEFSQTVFDN